MEIEVADRLLKQIQRLRRPSERIFIDSSRWLFPGVFKNKTSEFYRRLTTFIAARAFHDAVILIAQEADNQVTFTFDYYESSIFTNSMHPTLGLLDHIVGKKRTKFQLELESRRAA